MFFFGIGSFWIRGHETQSQKTALDIVLGRTDNSWYTGLKLSGNFNNSGIDLSGIQETEQVIKLAGNQKIVFTGGKYGDVSLYFDEESSLLTVWEGGAVGYISLLPFTNRNRAEKTIDLKSDKTKDKKIIH